jgi:hypothetical protein
MSSELRRREAIAAFYKAYRESLRLSGAAPLDP